MIVVQLPYPNKALWPNGRPHWSEKARETKKHREWAFMAAKAAINGAALGNSNERIPIRLTVSCKSRGVEPDKDNCLAASKAYLDGIAAALGVNDNLFDPQPVHFSGRQSNFTIEVG